MAQEPEIVAAREGFEVTDQQPPSPTGSNSSREETRAAREKLKKTSIAGLSSKIQNAENYESLKSDASTTNPGTVAASNAGPNGTRGRPAKKRSFEDLAKDDVEADTAGAVAQPPLPKSGHHKRMRSRDINSGDHAQAYAKIEGDANNTLHEETDMDAQKSPGGPGILVDAPSKEEMRDELASESTAVPTTHATSIDSSIKIPPVSGFADTSSASPFGAAQTKTMSPEPQLNTSTSAFASSGLSAFASSGKSPFGAASSAKSPLGSAGGFGGGSTGGFGPAKSAFAGSGGFSASGSSSFGGGSAAFGSVKGFGGTSTFGAPKPFGAPSSAFGVGSSTFSSGKPFGSSNKDDEDEGDGANEGDEDAASTVKDDAEQDPRFHEQQIDTGEAGEEAYFSHRARLYFFDGAWKERGTGTFKLNIRLTDEDDDTQDDEETQGSYPKRKARLLMRADATHRVLLNSPVFKGMRFGASDGTAPTGKIMHLQSLEDGKPVPLQIKIGKEDMLRELYDKLLELEAEA